ncbi:TetR family transcriptional regulator [Loigolactobacillus backii]|uniref:TetR family transcriptional regulator n=1 Tax=Loigolactobacillus backii TaxID=375175 RepID=A0A192H0M5_9LACO|nr:TetR/AcrR family transcriptional regulator [Loigolactobacillus backii]ANK61905.1 TetR family transcriptional regulator [Loigolactobacillus backii]ANK68901.1 TetR family transcriptional regulator [Loigolactobacillus backii]PIO82425.1 TetR family transcriptional regulator [Loigolactobacillus backii]
MRVTRTVRDFENALIKVLETTSFDAVTVEQICAEALLHRSSFYRYFNDKYDLLQQTMSMMLNQLLKDQGHNDDIIEQIVNFVDTHKEVFRNISVNNGRNYLDMEVLTVISRIMLARRDTKSQDALIETLRRTDQPEMLAYVLSGAIMGAFVWWRKSNYDLPKEQIISFIKVAVNGVKSFY